MASESSSIDSVGLRRRHERGDPAQTPTAQSESSSPSSAAAPIPSNTKLYTICNSALNIFGLGVWRPQTESQDATTAAKQLKTQLSSLQLDESQSPSFELTSFADAVSTARATSKFLLVYLHSPLHAETSTFCQNVLYSEEFCTYLSNSQSIVAWAGDVSCSEGYSVSLSFGAAEYPFLALVTCQTRGVSILEKFTGNVPVEILLRAMKRVMERNHQILATARHIDQQRLENQELRAQQDREYEASLEADRLRQEELERQQQAERDEQERIENEKISKIQKEEEEKLQFLQSLEAKRASLAKHSPPANRTMYSDATLASLRFHLPNGQKCQRVFYASDPMQFVRDFVDVELHDRDISIVRYELATNFPKRIYGPDELKLTLEKAGLSPQAVVFVQDLDS